MYKNVYFGYAANLKLAAVFNKNVKEISNYYLHIIAELKESPLLNPSEKAGQLAFLVREWESELNASAGGILGLWLGCALGESKLSPS